MVGYSVVWDVLDWVIQNAPGSYGLFYCHDDEDSRRSKFDNVYRVHRIKNGKLDELEDHYLGEVDGGLVPTHPMLRDEEQEELDSQSLQDQQKALDSIRPRLENY